MERSSCSTSQHHFPRSSSRLRALTRRRTATTTVAEGVGRRTPTRIISQKEVTVHLAKRVARNPFVPWKAWRREKYGYAAVPAAALPPTSDVLTSLRSIKTHRIPVQQTSQRRHKRLDSRKRRRSCVRKIAERGSGRVSSSHCHPHSKSAVSHKKSTYSTPCTPTTASSVYSSSRRRSRGLSAAATAAAAALYPLSSLSSSSSLLSTASVGSNELSCATHRTGGPPRSHHPSCHHQEQHHEQQQEQLIRRRCVREKNSRSLPWKVCGVRVARHRRAHISSCSSVSVVSETCETQWPLIDAEQHWQGKRTRRPCCRLFQRSEWPCCLNAAALHCRTAFPPSCSCGVEHFREACAASLVLHTEKLEARRLTFSRSPPPSERSAAAAARGSATATTAAAESSIRPPAAISETSSKTAIAVTVEKDTLQTDLVEGTKLVDDKNDACDSSAAAATITEASASAAHGLVTQTHMPAEVRGTASSVESPACPTTDIYRGTVTNPLDVPASQSRRDTCWDSSSTHPAPRGFFITLRSFNCKARRAHDMATSNTRTINGAEASITAVATSVVTAVENESQPDIATAPPMYATNSLWSPWASNVGFSQTQTNPPGGGRVLASHAGQTEGRTNSLDAGVAAGPTALSLQTANPDVQRRSLHAAGVSAAAPPPVGNAITVRPHALPTHYITEPSSSSDVAAASASGSKRTGFLSSNGYGTVEVGNATTVRPHPLPTHYITEPSSSSDVAAASATGSKRTGFLSSSGYGTVEVRSFGEEGNITCIRSESNQSQCTSTSAEGSLPVNRERNFATAVPSAEGYDAGKTVLLPQVQNRADMRDAASVVSVSAEQYRAALSSSDKLDAVEQQAQRGQDVPRPFNLSVQQNVVTDVIQEQSGKHPQLHQKQLRRWAQPSGRCNLGREYGFCGASTRRMHTESEGETDDSENGANCRRKEALRLSYLRLTKPRTNEGLHCTLSR